MSNSAKLVINQFNLHTKLFQNVVADITNAKAKKRLNSNTNHMAWLIGHTVSTRFMIASVLGLKVAEPFPELFGKGKGLDKEAKYPSMHQLTKDWKKLSEKLVKALNGLSEEALAAKAPFSMPGAETLGEFIAFLMHHEAYTLGQMGIVRRYHGLEAMKYS